MIIVYFSITIQVNWNTFLVCVNLLLMGLVYAVCVIVASDEYTKKEFERVLKIASRNYFRLFSGRV